MEPRSRDTIGHGLDQQGNTIEVIRLEYASPPLPPAANTEFYAVERNGESHGFLSIENVRTYLSTWGTVETPVLLSNGQTGTDPREGLHLNLSTFSWHPSYAPAVESFAVDPQPDNALDRLVAGATNPALTPGI